MDERNTERKDCFDHGHSAAPGADMILHHSYLDDEVEEVRHVISGSGRKAWIIKADFIDPAQAAITILLVNELTSLVNLVNSAAIFDTLTLKLYQ